MLLLTLAVSLGCTYATPKVPKKKVQRKKTVLVNVKDRVKNDANVANPNLPVMIQEGRYGRYYADTTSCNESSTAGIMMMRNLSTTNFYKNRGSKRYPRFYLIFTPFASTLCPSTTVFTKRSPLLLK